MERTGIKPFAFESWFLSQRRKGAKNGTRKEDKDMGDEEQYAAPWCFVANFSVYVICRSEQPCEMADIAEEIPLSGFDPESEPSICVMTDGSLIVEFNCMPPSDVPDDEDMGGFSDFDQQLAKAAGVEVIWQDREMFVIYEPKSDTIQRVQKYFENYRRK